MIDQTNIEGHVIVVTGAASGLGFEIAQHLVSKGAIVVAADKNVLGLNELAETVKDDVIHIREVDFLNDDAIIELIRSTELEVGPIKAVINCVGIVGQRDVLSEDIDLENFDLVYKINLRAAMLLSMECIKVMKPRKYGRILQGKEYAESGITINAMAPALINTPMVAGFSEKQRNFLKSKIPMNRIGDPVEAATLAAWIVSPACSFTTGFTFDLSGGRATY